MTPEQAIEKAMLDEIYQDFCKLDVDGSGKLNKAEVEAMVVAACDRNPSLDRDTLFQDLMTLDGDQDGKLSWAEFRTLITGEDPAKAAAAAAAAEEEAKEE